ncbi:MAG: stage 0 sporulation family protein [Clostridiales bacterium]|nr:stage 0 sporulation family protein [Clostridiales bacterium]
MTEVISVRFKNKGKVYFFDPAGLIIPSNVNVIVETSKGLEYAECTYGNHFVEDTAIIPPLRPVTRIATAEDDKKATENKAKEAEAFAFCQKKIEEHGLDMKLVDVEFNFEGSKILFFFTSDGRVDFRELVKDLASVFKTRIELRQIGVRDEARMLGGLGICGKPFCCTQFLDEFHPVSIKMAKTQGLSLNPVKISGTCGRLMCCLKYEENAYEDLVKKAPKVDAFVDTPAGKGSVISVNLLRGNAKVRLEDGSDATLRTFTFNELDILGGKARRAEYLAAKAEGKLEEAGFTEKPPAIVSSISRLDTTIELQSEQKHEAPAELKLPKKVEPSQRTEPRHQKGHSGKPPASKQDKKLPSDKVVTAAADEKKQNKKSKRRHRGGKSRKKAHGKKPGIGTPTTGSHIDADN